jgi:hypothetical protein
MTVQKNTGRCYTSGILLNLRRAVTARLFSLFGNIAAGGEDVVANHYCHKSWDLPFY